MHKVKIINEHETLVPTHIYIDDTEVHGVKSLEYFKAELDEVPVFKFETAGIPELIDIGQADIQFQFTPQTISEATEVVRRTLITDEYSHTALVASILSAIEDLNKTPNGMTDDELAKHIAGRIIGEE